MNKVAWMSRPWLIEVCAPPTVKGATAGFWGEQCKTGPMSTYRHLPFAS
jgi:hypothetical protein